MQTDRQSSSIFIVGYIHTGTSLLKTILRRNPAVWAAAGETHFFQDLAKIKRRFPDLTDEGIRRDFIIFLIKLVYLGNKQAMWHGDEWAPADFGLNDTQLNGMLTTMAGVNEHEALFGMVIDQLAANADKSFWIEKTPEHVYYLDQLLHYLPDARVIELVRDPRATLASRKLRQTGDEWLDTKESKESLQVDRMTNYDLLLDAMMWKEAINAARDARRKRPQNIITIRYEDLVTNPVHVVQRICEFTGLEYSDDMLEVGWVNAATQMSDADPDVPKAQVGISKSAIEKWRKSLEEDEIFLAQTILKSEMREMGYEPIPTGLGAKMRSPLLVGSAAINLTRRMSKERRSPDRAHAAFNRVQRRVLKNLGIQR